MQVVTQTPIDIIVVIQALVIVFVAAPALVRAIFRIKARRVAGPEAFAKGWGAVSESPQPPSAPSRLRTVTRARVMGILFMLIGLLIACVFGARRRARA